MNKGLIGIADTFAIYMDRSELMLNIIYDCFMNHITYIPIDTSWPVTRVQHVLADSGVQQIITEQKYADMFQDYQCYFLEQMNEWEQVLSVQRNNDISYVLYTSGSTGVPKGVAIRRDALINLIEGISEVVDIKKQDVIACLTSVSFDIFFVESVMARYLGMKVIMANNEEQNNPKLMAKLISENEVNVIQMTPSRMQLLLSYDSELKCLQKVKSIMIGGEAFPYNLLKILQNKTNAKIYNMYGPTETTVWSTISDLTKKDKITIGYPIKNTQVYIMDVDKNVVEAGETGEICIAGDGLAAGYVNRPELTAERFVRVKAIGDACVYRTGDNGRYLESGELECLGRMDNQIKLNGYRIELEEIEANLCSYSEITQALVSLEEKNEIKELVAYYISEHGLESTQIRDFLKDKMPVYMIPSAYRRVEQFNYTPNGKIDRHNLPVAIYEEEKKTNTDDSLSDLGRDILHNICAIVTTCNDEREILNLSFADVGIDSITYFGLIAKFEDLYDLMFDEYAMHAVNFFHISDFIEYCEQLVA